MVAAAGTDQEQGHHWDRELAPIPADTRRAESGRRPADKERPDIADSPAGSLRARPGIREDKPVVGQRKAQRQAASELRLAYSV